MEEWVAIPKCKSVTSQAEYCLRMTLPDPILPVLMCTGHLE